MFVVRDALQLSLVVWLMTCCFCFRLFGNSGACAACGHTIPASEFVMRAGAAPHVFHLKCFACSKCGAQLVQGDRYYLLAGSLVCEQDWHKLLKGSAVSGPAVRKGKVGRPRRSRDWGTGLYHLYTITKGLSYIAFAEGIETPCITLLEARVRHNRTNFGIGL